MTIITESTPIYTAGRYYPSGRGGAGNYHRLAADTLPTPPTALPAPSSASCASRYFAGCGGAGNVRDSSERAVFSFDEELERDRLFHSHAPVYSVGRGGAGNIVPSDTIATRSHYTTASAAATPRQSTSSDGLASSICSGADRVLSRLSKIRSSGNH
jgi:hypothetical protein